MCKQPNCAAVLRLLKFTIAHVGTPLTAAKNCRAFRRFRHNATRLATSPSCLTATNTAHNMNTAVTIRPANLNDINDLLILENASFQTDRLTRRNFTYLLTKAHAHTLIAEQAGKLCGYVMTLFSRGTSAARLYSIAVQADYARQGIAVQLLHAIETYALTHDYMSMRLEIRRDNLPSQHFFRKQGYRQFGEVADYYEDHEMALRFEKWLAPHLARDLVRVPYYQQSLEFTCGPAALLMAMNALNEQIQPDRTIELRIWREATTIYMTSGHGGCGPYGLALSAWRRGFEVAVYINSEAILFVDSVRNQQKKEVMRLVQADFLAEIATTSIALHYETLTVAQLRSQFDAGGIPLVLISSYQIYREKFPHWVVVTGFDERYVYIHDPFVDEEASETLADCINMPILQKDFEQMARYGKTGLKTVLILRAGA
jgi:ribosomal protein S18 acetylase RimI-like enzyme